MDHKLAQQTKTIDKYLMSDLTHEERLAFEEHMFECPECAAQVQQGFEMIDALKDVMRKDTARHRVSNLAQFPAPKTSWRDWFRPLTLGPALAALALAMVAGYQNLVTIPGMLQPQVLNSVTMVAATRGSAGQNLSVNPASSFFSANFQVFSNAVHPAYVCEFLNAANSLVTSMDCGKHATAEFTLSLLLPSAKFPPDVYTMVLRSASEKQVEVSRYSFAIRKEVN